MYLLEYISLWFSVALTFTERSLYLKVWEWQALYFKSKRPSSSMPVHRKKLHGSKIKPTWVLIRHLDHLKILKLFNFKMEAQVISYTLKIFRQSCRISLKYKIRNYFGSKWILSRINRTKTLFTPMSKVLPCN